MVLTLKPKVVENAVNDYYDKYTANIHRGDYKNSLIVSNKYEEVRDKVKNFINCENKDNENDYVIKEAELVISNYINNLLLYCLSNNIKYIKGYNDNEKDRFYIQTI